MTSIQKFLVNNITRKIKVAVVGDIGIDEYYEVDASRVSPEYAIPVMLASNNLPHKSVLGMAGNVCGQFKYFNADVSFIGLIDSYSKDLLNKSEINSENCISVQTGFNAPVKKRFNQAGFPLCRLDIEKSGQELFNAHHKEIDLLAQNYNSLTTPDVVILSDYNKGLFHTDVHRWIRQDCITIVDPKKGPISKWKGCTVFKPNFKEACELSGHTDPEDQCNYFYNELDCTAVVVTHGGKGVYGSVLGRFFEFVPKDKVSVASVIGAGDCFISFLAMALAHNVDIIDAIEIAYEAGAKYIQKGYNAPVSPSEFVSGIVLPELLTNRNYRLAFTNGCFDGGLTRGHVECLKFAKQQGDKLVVAINSDESVKRIKGEGRPFLPLIDRMEIVAALDCVDFVVSFDEDTPFEIIKKIEPNLIVKGGDYTKDQVIGKELASVVLCPYIDALSTTDKSQLSGWQEWIQQK